MNSPFGNRITGIRKAFAAAKQAQTQAADSVTITLPSVAATYAYVGRTLLRNGAPVEVRS